MPRPSTFSIVAYDPTDNIWGIAVASKFLAVGAVVPWARAGAGSVATQSYANTSFGPRGLALMENGASAQEALAILLREDEHPELRQAGFVDKLGNAATFTGESCYDWAGGITGQNFAAQGNILVGEQVVQEMANAFQNLPKLSANASGNRGLMWRLFAALQAGDQAGGDRRGRQSAAILVVKPGGGYGGFNDRWVDYRVDDHPDPVARLGELLELHDLYFNKSPHTDQVLLTGEVLRRLQSLLIRLGYYSGEAHGEYDAATRSALESFIGNENFEERIDFQHAHIDRPVLDYVLNKFGAYD